MNKSDTKERVTLLREIVATGKDAEKIKKFSDSLLNNAQSTLIETITKDPIESKDVMRAAYDFRAAFFLSSSIDNAIKKGVEKEDKLKTLLSD